MSEHHDHIHENGNVSKEEELKALLSYMIKHNKHHEEELSELLTEAEGEAQKLIGDAIRDFQAGNEKLEAALALTDKEK